MAILHFFILIHGSSHFRNKPKSLPRNIINFFFEKSFLWVFQQAPVTLFAGTQVAVRSYLTCRLGWNIEGIKTAFGRSARTGSWKSHLWFVNGTFFLDVVYGSSDVRPKGKMAHSIKVYFHILYTVVCCVFLI